MSSVSDRVDELWTSMSRPHQMRLGRKEYTSHFTLWDEDEQRHVLE